MGDQPGGSNLLERELQRIRARFAALGGEPDASDVELLRWAERSLVEHHEKLPHAVKATGMGLYVWDVRTMTTMWDETLCEMHGLRYGEEPVSADAFIALLHPDDRQRVGAMMEHSLATGRVDPIEFRIVRPDGEVRWLLMRGAAERGPDGKVTRMLGGVIDVHAQRLVEAQLVQSQRMEAVGQLTAGIAHHFNNLLMAILPNVQMAAELAPFEAVAMLKDAEQAARRAADLVKQLTMFAGRTLAAPHSPQSLVHALERAVAMCRATFERHVAIAVHIDESAPAVVMDPGKVEQALMNVLINARDAVLAVPSGRAARIEVRLERVPADDEAIAGHAGARPVEHLCVRVTDNGVGMDAETMARMYEPFFTTKDVGLGTGLGLSTTYAIVRDHGGWMDCVSTRGEGTTVRLFLPADAAAVRDAPPPVPAPPPARRASLLLVDDELMIRNVVRRILEAAGFEVHAVPGAEEALRLIEDKGADAFDLALIDVSMPGMSGPQLVERLRTVAPSLRAVYLTGYDYKAGSEVAGVIDKPITPERLVHIVRALVGSGGARKAV